MNRVQEQKHHLTLANRQIAELTVQIVRQRAIVKHALDAAQRSEMAESLLDALEGNLRIFERHRIFLLSCSEEFDGVDATEKAGIEGSLNRCRRLAAQIESELRNKRREHFVDKLSLADLCTSLEEAADVLGQKGRRSAETTPVVKGSQAQHRHR